MEVNLNMAIHQFACHRASTDEIKLLDEWVCEELSRSISKAEEAAIHRIHERSHGVLMRLAQREQYLGARVKRK